MNSSSTQNETLVHRGGWRHYADGSRTSALGASTRFDQAQSAFDRSEPLAVYMSGSIIPDMGVSAGGLQV